MSSITLLQYYFTPSELCDVPTVLFLIRINPSWTVLLYFIVFYFTYFTFQFYSILFDFQVL